MSGAFLKLNESDGRSPVGIDMVIEVALPDPPSSPVLLGSYDGATGRVVDAFASDQGLATNGFEVLFEASSDEEVVVHATNVHGDAFKPVYRLTCHSAILGGVLVTCHPFSYGAGKAQRTLFVE